MDLRAFLRRLRSKWFRYASTSILGTVVSQALIVIFHEGANWEGVPTNIAAVVLTSVPAFWLSKRWVWSKLGAHSLRREVIPFWSMNLAGLALSTLFVWVAERWSDAVWVVNLSNIAGFGVLWLAKFWVLDEYLFRPDEIQGDS